jgi:hypothetical protein
MMTPWAGPSVIINTAERPERKLRRLQPQPIRLLNSSSVSTAVPRYLDLLR